VKRGKNGYFSRLLLHSHSQVLSFPKWNENLFKFFEIVDTIRRVSDTYFKCTYYGSHSRSVIQTQIQLSEDGSKNEVQFAPCQAVSLLSIQSLRRVLVTLLGS